MKLTRRSVIPITSAVLLAACGGNSPMAPTAVELPATSALGDAAASSRVEAMQTGCPRSPGFWCQNQEGKNPNLTAEDFDTYAQAAATSLAAVEELDTAEEVAAAVCDKSDQLLRFLATLALDLAADHVAPDTPVAGEDFATVGEAFAEAILVATDPAATREERNEIKDVLDRIVNGDNLETPCEPEDEDDDGDDGDGGDGDGGDGDDGGDGGTVG